MIKWACNKNMQCTLTQQPTFEKNRKQTPIHDQMGFQIITCNTHRPNNRDTTIYTRLLLGRVVPPDPRARSPSGTASSRRAKPRVAMSGADGTFPLCSTCLRTAIEKISTFGISGTMLANCSGPSRLGGTGCWSQSRDKNRAKNAKSHYMTH